MKHLYVVVIFCTLAIAQDSKRAIDLPQFWDKAQKPIIVRSPNKEFAIEVRPKKTGARYPEEAVVPDYFISRGSKRIATLHLFATPRVMWSSDSQAVVVTFSDGGLVGTWNVLVYYLENGKPNRVEVMSGIRSDVARRYPVCEGANSNCSPEERRVLTKDVAWVNVEALEWQKGSKRLVLVGSIPCSSGYGANMCKKRLYVLAFPSGKVLESADFEDSLAIP